MGEQTKRRHILVDSKVQRHYLFVWAVISASFTLAMLAISFFSVQILSSAPINPRFLEHLSVIIKSNTVLIILVTLFMGLYTVLLSHRIAGPSYRIRDTIRQVLGERRFEARIKLRDQDYMREVAEDVNRLIARLELVQRDAREAVEELDGIAARLGEIEGAPPELEAAAADLRAATGRLAGHLRLSTSSGPLDAASL